MMSGMIYEYGKSLIQRRHIISLRKARLLLQKKRKEA